MTKFVRPGGYQPEHTGKSGYIATSPRGAPVPYGIIEELSSNLYPQARQFVPKDLRKYTDSYYDLRNKQYKVWYDKWGKPHVNKWWKSQLKYEKILQEKPWKTSTRKPYTAFSKSTRKYSSSKYRSCTCPCTCSKSRRSKYDSNSYRKRRQNYGSRQWKARRVYNNRRWH